jgi:hypothetical protein
MTLVWQSHDVRSIQELHDRARVQAYELGRLAAAEGRTQNPLDICDSLDKAFDDGWRDEKAGKP